MLDMIRKDVLPAVSRFTGELVSTARAKSVVCGESACTYEMELAGRLSGLVSEAWKGAQELERSLDHAAACHSTEEIALCCWQEMLPKMSALRRAADAMETITDKTCWPYPSYGEILFSVY